MLWALRSICRWPDSEWNQNPTNLATDMAYKSTWVYEIIGPDTSVEGRRVRDCRMIYGGYRKKTLECLLISYLKIRSQALLKFNVWMDPYVPVWSVCLWVPCHNQTLRGVLRHRVSHTHIYTHTHRFTHRWVGHCIFLHSPAFRALQLICATWEDIEIVLFNFD